VNFKITKQIYKTVITLAEELIKNGFGVSVKTVKIESAAEKVEMNPKAKITFKELFDEYVRIKEMPLNFSFDNPHYKLSIIESVNPLVKEAFDKLGKEKVEELKYNQTNIRREILKKLDISTEHKIVQMINDSISYYTAIPNITVKEKIQNIYDRKSDEAMKAEYQEVLKCLKKEISIEKTAKICDVSKSTVQRVKKRFLI